MFNLPYQQRLEGATSILIAGAGGGFDVYGGLPLYFALKRQGRNVHLANLSFTILEAVEGGRKPLAGLVGVTADCTVNNYYFPEAALARWLKTHKGWDEAIWSFAKSGVVPLIESYRWIIEELKVDAIVLVDGGIDSLLRGDEEALGTPVEDALSLAAVRDLPVPVKMLCCLAIGAEKIDDISLYRVLENMAGLTAEGAFLGAVSLVKEMEEVRDFVAASWHGHDACQPRGSVIMTSMIAAFEGHYGDYHPTPRTAGSELWINPLMPVYWYFDAVAVAQRNRYLPAIMKSTLVSEVVDAILDFRKGREVRSWTQIPV